MRYLTIITRDVRWRLYTQFALLGVLLCLSSGCATQSLMNEHARDWASRPIVKMLYAPAEFRIYEVPLGGKEERVIAWEKQAAEYFDNAMEGLNAPPNREFVAAKSLDSTLYSIISQHYALFCTMVPQMMLIKGNVIEAWANKRDHFNYTVGPGMAPVAQATGADLIVFAIGQDRIRSNSRRVFDGILSLNVFTMGQKAQTGTLVMAILDLKTGDIVWLDNDFTTRMSFNDEADIAKMTRNVLGAFYGSVGSTL